MAISVVATSGWGVNTVAIPAGTQAGDLMIAFMGGVVGTLNIDQGWTKVTQCPGSGRLIAFAYKVHTGSETAPTLSGASSLVNLIRSFRSDNGWDLESFPATHAESSSTSIATLSGAADLGIVAGDACLTLCYRGDDGSIVPTSITTPGVTYSAVSATANLNGGNNKVPLGNDHAFCGAHALATAGASSGVPSTTVTPNAVRPGFLWMRVREAAMSRRNTQGVVVA